MLQTLRISNLAVVAEAEVHFGPGLTVVTGETGAGKSLVVDALGLLLGGRADPEVVRAGAEEASVEAVLYKGGPLTERLAELGLPDLGDELCIRRTVGRNGRSRAYVNGTLVAAGVLAKLMRGWLQIAGQHEPLALLDPSTHLKMLDRIEGVPAPALEFAGRFAALEAVESKISALAGGGLRPEGQRDLLRHQLDELARFAPAPGEEEALEAERRRLSQFERLRQLVAEAEGHLSSDECAALERLSRGAALLVEAERIDAKVGPLAQAVASLKAELDDRVRTLGRYVAGLEGDPQRLEEIEERLGQLRRLCRKHGTDLAGLCALQSELTAELAALEGREQALAALQQEKEAAQSLAWRSARALSQARETAARRLEREVQKGLAQLALGKAKFSIDLRSRDLLTSTGCDEVEFRFSANPGEPLRPLDKVASGGEVSRLALSLKWALADSDACGCFVLDEVDSGVSGAVAEEFGRLIQQMSAHCQVVCVTHLAQVAAFGDAHLRVEKEQRAGRTRSFLLPLSDQEARTRELARMLSGVQQTREALGAARALVRSARTGRRSSRPPRPNLALGRVVA